MGVVFRDDLWVPSTVESVSEADSASPISISDTCDDQGSLWILPGDEQVHEVLNYSIARWAGEEKTYPSIWHWIIMKNIESEIARTIQSQQSSV